MDAPPPPDPTHPARGEDIRGLRAFAHPLRMRLLSLLKGTALSAAEAARELAESQANVSYHLRRLRAAGLVEVAEEARIRGGLAKRYRHVPASGRQHAPASPDDHRILTAALAEEMRRRATLRRPDEDGHATDAELWVDPRTWAELVERFRQAATDLHEAARPPHSPGCVRVSATVLLFEMLQRDRP